MGSKVRKLFLDTSFLCAWLNEDDDFHNSTLGLIESLRGKQVYFFLTDYIIDETLTLILVRANKRKAIEVANKITEFCIRDPHMKLVYIQKSLFIEAIKIFCEFKDKNWSFTDCTSYIVMKTLQISEGASFDRHFKEFGCRILP